tara:strand:- start:117 stop:350 length:234 start_codon:yes stop_codon:yes gene_type:complete
MDTITIAIIAIGLATNLLSFLFGMLVGRNTAYKTARTFQIADTQNMFKISPGQAMADRYRAFKSGFKHASKKYQTDQ